MHVVIWHSYSFQQRTLSCEVGFIPFFFEFWEILLLPFFENGIFHELLRIGPFLGIDIDHELKQGPEITAEVLWNFRQLPLEDFLIQTLHVLGLERGLKSNHFINDAS